MESNNKIYNKSSADIELKRENSEKYQEYYSDIVEIIDEISSELLIENNEIKTMDIPSFEDLSETFILIDSGLTYNNSKKIAFKARKTSKNIISFSDENLKIEILKILGLNSNDEISREDAQSVNTLNLSDKSISNLDGLQYFKNLTTLSIYNNEIEDISVLSNLINLTTLHLFDNKIRNIQPLSKLKKLRMLSLSNNRITDIKVLSSLKYLTYLSLSNNYLENISPLANLTNLTYLSLYNNNIREIRY